jgi:hypothetical protein
LFDAAAEGWGCVGATAFEGAEGAAAEQKGKT